MAVNPTPTDARGRVALSALELRVVALARSAGEIVAGLPDGRAARFLAVVLAILGRRNAGPLANARLEALRRLAVTLYHRSDRGAATIAQYLAAGLSIGDIDAVRAVVGNNDRRAT